MKKSELGIAIARDVLSRIKRRKLRVHTGTYIYGGIENASLDDQAQTYIDVLENNCEVCALGGLLLSYVRLKNNCSLHDMGCINSYYTTNGINVKTTFSKIYNILKVAFSKKTMWLLECAFEQSKMSRKMSSLSMKKVYEAIDFGKRFKTDRTRLVGIMKNIINNDGKFIP